MAFTEQGDDEGVDDIAFANDDLLDILPDLLGKVLNCLACQKVPPCGVIPAGDMLSGVWGNASCF